jgi:hypothetical protein
MRLETYLIEVEQKDLTTLKKYVDGFWKKLNVDIQFTRHFLDQANDERNDPAIDLIELKRLFKVWYQQHGKEVVKLTNNTQAVVKDLVTKVNMPFVIEWDEKNKEWDITAKTIQRKGNFMTKNRVFELKPGFLP